MIHQLLSILLHYQLQENCILSLLVASSENGDSQFSDEEMISTCINFLFAAYDTTSFTLSCASYLLATHPHIQDKICALLDDYWSQNKVLHAVKSISVSESNKCMGCQTLLIIEVVSLHKDLYMYKCYNPFLRNG